MVWHGYGMVCYDMVGGTARCDYAMVSSADQLQEYCYYYYYY